ncbi:MAG: glycoside hydrolase family 18 protein [Fibrobacter sp.]|nr:glycoside hydrolase family 18 protein [Fibrobacter sp.]
MHIKHIPAALTIIFLLLNSSWAANVVAYFINWGIYGDNPYTPLDVPYDKLTHIQYAFFEPQTNGDISSFDEYADEVVLLGQKIWYPVETCDSTTSLVYLAHQHNVKVLPSIGGWTGSGNFPALAGSAASRSNFCSKARALIEQYNFDGIDIDWEYPCFSEHNGTPQDAQNFVTLLSELRDTLDLMSGERKLITLAIAAGPYHGKNFLVEQFYPDVDYISIMTYDYTGAWGQELAWINSPLYDYGSEDNWSISRSMEYYVSRGVPASRLNIGMAFYGRTFAGCAGPNKTYAGAGAGEQGEPGMMYYSTIVENLQNGTYSRYWDETAKAPYCLSTTGEYCTYDDTASIRIKAQYCVDNGFAGAIIWELKAGTLADGSQPLLSTASGILKSQVSAGKKKNGGPGNLVLEPSVGAKDGYSIVRFSLANPAHVAFSVYDMGGRTLWKKGNLYRSGFQEFALPGTAVSAGRYLLNISSGMQSFIVSFCVLK